MTIKGVQLQVVVNTGAEVSVVSTKVYVEPQVAHKATYHPCAGWRERNDEKIYLRSRGYTPRKYGLYC